MMTVGFWRISTSFVRVQEESSIKPCQGETGWGEGGATAPSAHRAHRTERGPHVLGAGRGGAAWGGVAPPQRTAGCRAAPQQVPRCYRPRAPRSLALPCLRQVGPPTCLPPFPLPLSPLRFSFRPSAFAVLLSVPIRPRLASPGVCSRGLHLGFPLIVFVLLCAGVCVLRGTNFGVCSFLR